MSAELQTVNEAYLAPITPKADAPTAPEGTGVPFVAFRGKKSEKNLEALTAAGIAESEFYLMENGTPRRVQPFTLHLMRWDRFYTKMDDDMNLIRVAWDDENRTLDEQIEALVLVAIATGPDTPSAFVPARASFRKAQVAALKPAINLLSEGGAAHRATDMLAYGKAFEPASKSPIPAVRFRLSISSRLQMPKQGTRPYNLGVGVVIPTPERDVAAITEYLSSPGGRARANAANAAFEARRAELAAQADASIG